MGLRFRKTWKIFPGLKLNLTKRGLSTSFGVPGATINAGQNGVTATAGIPGTGVCYRKKLSATDRVENSMEPVTQPQKASWIMSTGKVMLVLIAWECLRV